MENNNNTQEPQTVFYVATLLIDVEKLRKTRAEDIGDEAANEEDLDEAISQEMGWVTSSGVGAYNLEKIEPTPGKLAYLATVTCAYDGFEFEEKTPFLLEAGVDPKAEADKFARGFEANEEPKFDQVRGVYCFDSGKDVWVSDVQPISEADYHALKKYL
jgi:hypothetical protein